VEDFYDTDVRLQPIGLAYLKAVVKQELPEVEVNIIDFHHGWGRRTVPIPKELSFLKKFYNRADQSPFRLFHNYFRFGATDEVMREVLTLQNPDIVGISSLFTAYYKASLQVAYCVKECTSATVIMGGSHASAVPESLLKDSSVDFVIRGEGEIPLVELLKLLIGNSDPDLIDLARVSSLGYKSKGKLKFNPIESHPDINRLPLPNLDDLPLKSYQYSGRPLVFVITSRSCPHHCSFCSVHTTFGDSYRKRSVEGIFSEIRYRIDQGYRAIDFEDDNLTLRKSEMKELCRRIANESFPETVEFLAMNGISYQSLDRELLELMKIAGFKKLNLSLVSSDQNTLFAAKRPHKINKFREIVRIAHELGFVITAYQILGFPGETLQSMIQTLCFLSELPILIGGSPFYLIPDSPIALKLNVLINDEVMIRSRLTALANETEHYSRSSIYTLLIGIRIINFLKTADIPNGVEVPFSRLLSNMRAYFPDSLFADFAGRSLQSLFEKGILLGNDKKQEYPVEKFQFETWRALWERMQRIVTTTNGAILTDIPGLKVWK
jgi:radical SAM superfamily enzyme YgiQ (UPF0313 family)